MTEAQTQQLRGQTVLLFDGTCGLCNRAVRFFLRRDPAGRLLYVPLESALGRELLARHGTTPEQLNSIGLVEAALTPEERFFTYSTAVARAMRQLRAPWPWVGRLILVFPAFLRNSVYRLIARVRYRIFGRTLSCPLPRPGERQRFAGIEG